MESANKSRDQKFYQYFVILQKEYIVAELRKKIYPDIPGKSKSQEIMEGKKKKVFDIAFKNSIKTIFPDMKIGTTSLYDEELRTKLYLEIYGECGLPNFIYRDERQKQLLSEKDRRCYFMLGSEFRYEDLVGELVDINFREESCVVVINGSKIKASMHKVARIL